MTHGAAMDSCGSMHHQGFAHSHAEKTTDETVTVEVRTTVDEKTNHDETKVGETTDEKTRDLTAYEKETLNDVWTWEGLELATLTLRTQMRFCDYFVAC